MPGSRSEQASKGVWIVVGTLVTAATVLSGAAGYWLVRTKQDADHRAQEQAREADELSWEVDIASRRRRSIEATLALESSDASIGTPVFTLGLDEVSRHASTPVFLREAGRLTLPIESMDERRVSALTLVATDDHFVRRFLDVAELEELERVRAAAAHADIDWCATLWTEEVQPDRWYRAFSALPEAQVRDWFRLLALAQERALSGRTVARIDSLPFARVVEEAWRRIPPASRTEIEPAFQRLRRAPPETACAAYLALEAGTRTLEPVRRAVYLTTLAQQSPVDALRSAANAGPFDYPSEF